jgi:hypothetical protein
MPLVELKKDVKMWGNFMQKVKGGAKSKGKEGVEPSVLRKKLKDNREGRLSTHGKMKTMKESTTNAGSDTGGVSPPMRMSQYSARSPLAEAISPPNAQFVDSPLNSPHTRSSVTLSSSNEPWAKKPNFDTEEMDTPSSPPPTDSSARFCETPDTDADFMKGKKRAKSKDIGNSPHAIAKSIDPGKSRKTDAVSRKSMLSHDDTASHDGRSPPKNTKKPSFPHPFKMFQGAGDQKAASAFDLQLKKLPPEYGTQSCHEIEIHEDVLKSRHRGTRSGRDSVTEKPLREPLNPRPRSVPQNPNTREDEIPASPSGAAPKPLFMPGASDADFVMYHLKLFEESEKDFLDDLSLLLLVHFFLSFLSFTQFLTNFFSSKRRLFKNLSSLPLKFRGLCLTV